MIKDKGIIYVQWAGIIWFALSCLFFVLPIFSIYFENKYLKFPSYNLPIYTDSLKQLWFFLPGIISSIFWFIPCRMVTRGWEYSVALIYLILEALYYILIVFSITFISFYIQQTSKTESIDPYDAIILRTSLAIALILLATIIIPSFITLYKMRCGRKELRKTEPDD